MLYFSLRVSFGNKFSVRLPDPKTGKLRWFATPLLLALMFVEIVDLVFAIDSVPAIFAITSDPFIVYTSNIFAILGLRAMFFLLQAVATKFHLLNYGLAVILVFIGTKMMIIDLYKIPVVVSLGVVVGILAITMIWSVRTAPKIDTHKS
jgi:tellurite resistance protein TerC